MKSIANFFWIILIGLWTAISYYLLGIVWCLTIVGIPFGLQCFKFGKLSFAPFGKKVNTNFGKHAILNVIWFVFGGFALALSFFLVGLVFCVTIVGIPLGLQSIKMSKLSVAPFGAEIV